MIWQVWDQRLPVFNRRTKEYEANLVPVGTVEAPTAAGALKLASRTMSRWPMVAREAVG